MRSCTTGLCAAICGQTDDSCDGQADALQRRRLSPRPRTTWPTWLGKTTRRLQNGLCLCGSAVQGVPALGRDPTPLRIGVWSRGRPTRQRGSGNIARRPTTEVAHCVPLKHDGQPWQRSAEHWATMLHAVVVDSTGVNFMRFEAALLRARAWSSSFEPSTELSPHGPSSSI